MSHTCTLLAHFGTPCQTLAHFWHVLGHRVKLWHTICTRWDTVSNTGTLFAHVGTPCQTLAHFWHILDTVSNSGTRWDTVSNSCTLFAHVSNSGTRWDTVSNSCTLLAHFGTPCRTLAHFWHVLGHRVKLWHTICTRWDTVSNSCTLFAHVSNSGTRWDTVSNSCTLLAHVGTPCQTLARFWHTLGHCVRLSLVSTAISYSQSKQATRYCISAEATSGLFSCPEGKTGPPCRALKGVSEKSTKSVCREDILSRIINSRPLVIDNFERTLNLLITDGKARVQWPGQRSQLTLVTRVPGNNSNLICIYTR